MRPVPLVCACLLLASSASAQPAPPDPDALMGSLEPQLARLGTMWLQSTDPRFQAWGAYFVLRDRRTDVVPDLLARLAATGQRDVMLAVLDALIQLDAQAPVSEAERLYPEFPVQSLILLARAGDDAAPALLEIFKSEPRWPAAWLAAGALLLNRRAEGFAAAVVEGMTVHAEIIVTEPNSGGGRGGGNLCCGAALPRPPKAGWPPVGLYAFAGCGDSVEPGATVLVAGPDPAYYVRQISASYEIEGAPSCGCNPDRDLVRQHYLTSLLFGSPEHPPVRAHVSHTIVWQSVENYSSDVVAFRAEQQRILSDLMRQLAERNLLTEDQAKSLRPKLDVSIWDQRASPQPPLPELSSAAAQSRP